ncbi:DUF2079 domain-containing protein [Myceligenerans crystallogenes]|uniref:DUF2079 domain-containing protein n=1 Tax=Myceligenerans crystallogenes TaxID=316335 RepID=A0ABP4ZSI1_9MICO
MLTPERVRTAPRHLRAIAGAAAVPAVVTLLVTSAYVVYSLWQWRTFTVKSWDLGIFTQMYQGYASGGVPIVAIKGQDFNLLGDHFHPLLAVFTPVYALFPSALTLLVVQGACFGIAGGIVAWAAHRLIGPVSGTLIGLACGLSWGLQYAVDAQFHEIALAVPLLAGSLAAVVTRHWRWACGIAAFLPFVKEDQGLTVAGIGVVLVLLRQRRLGIALTLWGLLWFALAVFVVLPWLNPEEAWEYGKYLTGGDDAPDPAPGPPFNLFAPQKALTMTLLAVATAGMMFRSPVALVLLPTLAWRFVSTNESYWAPDWHYSAVLMPVAFMAAVDGIARARAASSSDWERWWARLAPVAIGVACVAIAFLKPLPLTQVKEPGLLTPDPRAAAVEDVLGRIPDDATVLSDLSLMNYAVGDHELYWIGTANPVPDYVLAGPTSTGPNQGWLTAVDMAVALHPGVAFELVVERDGYSLARRTGDDVVEVTPEPVPPEAPPANGH